MESTGTPITEQDKAEGRFVRPRRILLLADVVSVCLAVAAMYGVLHLRDAPLQQNVASLLMAGLTIASALALLMREGQYTARRRMSRLHDIGALARAMVISAAAVTLVNYLTKGFFTGDSAPSRLAVGWFWLIFFVCATASRFALRAYQRRQFARGQTVRKILILGAGQQAADFVEFLQKRPWLGAVPVGRIVYRAPSGSSGQELSSQVPVLARLTEDLDGLKSLDQLLRSSGASEIVVALDLEDQTDLPWLTGLLSLVRVPFKVVPSLFEQSYRATELLGYEELPVIDVDVDPLDRVARLFKRAMDVTLSLLALILLAPLELAIVASIVLESGFPVFYKQERVGKNGRHFLMFKFRTMVKDADQRIKELEAQNEAGASGQMFKMREDPRVTRVGAVLRKVSLDELPQVVNVLREEMSLVGPRPPLPREVDKYEPQHFYRLRGLPGITGLWQVSGRSDLSFEDMVKLDRYYLDNWSLRLDISIILKTFLVVLTGKGAY